MRKKKIIEAVLIAIGILIGAYIVFASDPDNHIINSIKQYIR